ncbi:embigin [Tiliqua scincoides]|uniref:embigin n=1 Tax=Tiliqua scincoides TaxID=71010 RepID=UPI00346236D2
MVFTMREESSITTQTENSTPNVTLTKHQINITAGDSKAEENIIVEKPTDLDLKCSLPLNLSLKIEIIDVVWELNNRTIREHNITRSEIKSSWCTWHMAQVRNKDELGSYTCSFKSGNVLQGYGAFHVKVPEIEGHSKQTISYVGDIVALTCKTGNYTPLYWAWYTKNGSEEVAINGTLMPEKYTVSQKYANDTKLLVHNLSEKDDGDYWCKVVFELGESHRSGSLRVLTYMAPLKPFLAIVAEVLIFVTLIFVYEMYSKKKGAPAEVEKEFEQTEQLKSEDSNGVENNTTRHRKV